MSAPIDVTTLQSFLEIVNCYRLYVHKMHKLTASFNKLLKKNSKCNSSAGCKK